MKRYQSNTILSILIFSIALMLSGNAFAGKPGSTTSTYAIGGTGPGGGIIFHVSDDGKHGLEAAPIDQSIGVIWYKDVNATETNAAKSGINGGSFNTDRIISAQGQGTYAAMVAANYNGGGYGDWYLPSKDELNLMHSNLYLNNMGSFTGGTYWSSSEWLIHPYAWANDFVNSSAYYDDKGAKLSVRAVRAF